MAGAVNVGQLIPYRQPYPEFLGTVDMLLADANAIHKLAEETFDRRMDRNHWRATLTVELNLLARWGARRFIEIPASQRMTSIGHKRILSLLPSYGFALHILRRAAPFAILGIPTTISVRPDLIPPAEACLAVLRDILGLADSISLSGQSPAALVASFAASGDPIVLTGKRDTFTVLRVAYPKARIFAATGNCLVVMGSSSKNMALVEQAMARKRLNPSCSNMGLSIVCDDEAPNQAIRCLSGELARADFGTVQQEIVRVHPTVVLSIPGDDSKAWNADTVAGYKIIVCDEEGVPYGLDGVARDPIGGWPGDYVI
jgi:hypothetical protein